MIRRLSVGVVVEGHGEREALPILLRRIAADFCPELDLRIEEPIRHSRGRLVKEEGLKRAVGLAVLKAGGEGFLVVLIDSDDDCPKELAPTLRGWIAEARADIDFTCVLARREFEAWLLAGIESLRGRRGIPLDAEVSEDPEEDANPKAHLDRLMGSRDYSETLDQPAFAAVFDYEAAAAKSRSLRKLVLDFREQLLRVCPDAARS